MKENNELTRDDIAIDHDMEVDCDEGREIAVYSQTRGCTESQDRSRSGLEERGAKGKVFI